MHCYNLIAGIAKLCFVLRQPLVSELPDGLALHTQRIREMDFASHFDMTPAYLIVAMHN